MATAQDIQSTVSKPLSYVYTLGSAVLSGITGGAVGASLGPVGLVTMFFQTMFTGIANAEAKGKMHDLVIAWQDDNIGKMYDYNQLQEEYIKEQIRKQAEVEQAQIESDMTQAKFIHFFLALIVVVITILLLFVMFPKKGR